MDPSLYISPPAIHLPETKVGNDEMIDRVKQRYQGNERTWSKIERGIHSIFDRCNSKERYLSENTDTSVAEFAAQAGKKCLDQHGVKPEEIDLLIYAGVAREYYEPATAMEVSARLGCTTLQALDMTSACAGQLEALHAAAGYFQLHPDMDTAMIVSGEITRSIINYDIQSINDLRTRGAGLTIGNAASAWLVRRSPLRGGCLKVKSFGSMALPQNWELCQARTEGSFTSHSHELFKLSDKVAPEIQRILGSVYWTPQEIDHYVLHQPSDHTITEVLTELNVPLERGIKVHSLYGNTVSTTVSLAFHELLKHTTPQQGEKFTLVTAAAGFSIATILGEWCHHSE